MEFPSDTASDASEGCEEAEGCEQLWAVHKARCPFAWAESHGRWQRAVAFSQLSCLSCLVESASSAEWALSAAQGPPRTVRMALVVRASQILKCGGRDTVLTVRFELYQAIHRRRGRVGISTYQPVQIPSITDRTRTLREDSKRARLYLPTQYSAALHFSNIKDIMQRHLRRQRISQGSLQKGGGDANSRCQKSRSKRETFTDPYLEGAG